MTDQTVGTIAPEFRIWRVINRSFSVLFRNFVPFYLLAILFSVLPMLLQALPFLPEGLQHPETLTDFSALTAEIAIAVGLTVLVYLVCTSLLSAILVYGTIVQLRGGHAGIMECLVKGIGLIFPVLLLILLLYVIFILTVFPTFVLGSMWLTPFVGIPVGFAAMATIATVLWVVIPVAVVERPGIIASLKRSIVLTRGARWRVLGLIVSLIVLSLIYSTVVMTLLSELATMSLTENSSLLWVQIISVLVSSLSLAYSAVVVAVSYHDLRIAKEGVDSTQIAAVFD